MRRIALLVAAFVLAAGCNEPTKPDNTTASLDSDNNGSHAAVVHVAAPTGDPAIDVSNIEAAVAAAAPGSVIKFARGTYRILETTNIVVSVPGVTLEGHRRGTTIGGVTAFAAFDFLLGHFLLNGGNQTVRDLTFDGFATALSVGEVAPAERTGGYRLENSTFRNGDVAFESVTFSDEVSTVRGNRFIDVGLPFVILGKAVHFLGNSNTNPNPANTPGGRPINAGVLLPEFLSGINICENNLFEGNTIVGNADGFILVDCQNIVVRRNTFVGQRLFPGNEDFPSFDDGSMVVGIGANLEGNLIEKNKLHGSPGIGIIVEEGSGNRIVENKFRDLVPGELAPFHATLLGEELAGTGILLGEPTTGNRVCKNKFKNVVNTIVDLGTGNIICEGQGDGDFAAVSAPRVRVTGKGSRVLEHPKLRFLKERMKN